MSVVEADSSVQLRTGDGGASCPGETYVCDGRRADMDMGMMEGNGIGIGIDKGSNGYVRDGMLEAVMDAAGAGAGAGVQGQGQGQGQGRQVEVSVGAIEDVIVEPEPEHVHEHEQEANSKAKDVGLDGGVTADEKVLRPRTETGTGTQTEIGKDASVDTDVAPGGSTAVLDAAPTAAAAAAAAAEAMPPTVVKEDRPATTGDREVEESIAAMHEFVPATATTATTIGASPNATTDPEPTSSPLAEPPTSSSSSSSSSSSVSANLETETEPRTGTEAVPGPEGTTNAEGLPAQVPDASEPAEAGSAGRRAGERGSSASYLIEAGAGGREESIRAQTPDNVATTALVVDEDESAVPVSRDVVDEAGVVGSGNGTMLADGEKSDLGVVNLPVQIPVVPEDVPVDVRESTVEPHAVIEEAVPPAAEISTQKPAAEPVVDAKDAHSETEAIPELVVPAVAEPVKEEAATIPSVEATAASESEAVKEPTVASTVGEEVEISTQKLADPASNVKVAHSETEVVPQAVVPAPVKEEAVVTPSVEAPVVPEAETEAIPEPVVPAVAEPVKEEAAATPSVEVTAAPESEALQEPTVVSTVGEEAAEISTQKLADTVSNVEVAHNETEAAPVKEEVLVTPPVEAPVVSEAEAAKEPSVAGTVGEETVPPAAEISTQKPAAETVTNVEAAHNETEAAPVKEEVLVTPPVEAPVVSEAEAVKEPIVISTVGEEVAIPAPQISTQTPAAEAVANVEAAYNETKTIPEPVAPVAAEPVKEEVVTALSVEASVAPEVEAVKESIVAGTVGDEAVPPAVEIFIQKPAVEPVANVEVAHSDTKVIPESVVPGSPTLPAETPIVPEAEAAKESIIASPVVEVAPPAETFAHIPVEPAKNIEVTPMEQTTSLEPAAEESAPVDASEHTQSSQVHVPSEATSENISALTGPLVSTAAPARLSEADDEPAETASSKEPSAEILFVPTAVQEAVGSAAADADVHTSTEVSTQVEEPVVVKEKDVTEEAVADVIVPAVAETAKEEVMVTPPVEAPVLSEIGTVKGSIVELNTAIRETAPSTVEPIVDSAMEPVTNAENAPREEVTVSEPAIKANLSVDAIVTSEPAQPTVAEVHIPSEPTSEDASTLTKAPVAVPPEVSVALPAELVAVASSTVLPPETPSTLDVVEEVAVTDSVAADVDVRAPAEDEEPVTKPVASEEIVEVAPTGSAPPNASKVAPKENHIAPELEAQGAAVSEHPKTSIQPESFEASKGLSAVSQQASSAAEPVVASEHTPETIPTPTTQDDIASTNVINVIEEPEESATPATAIVKESAVKDVDIPSNVVLAAGYPESLIGEPTPAFLPAKQPLTDVVAEDSELMPIEELAPTPAIITEGQVAVQDNEDTIAEAPSKAVQEHSTVDEPQISIHLEGTPVVAVATSAEPPNVETPIVATGGQSAERKVSTEPALASEESIGTSMLEPHASSGATVEHPFVGDVGESFGPRGGVDVIERTKVVVDQGTVLSQDAETPVISIVEKTSSISADEEVVSVSVPEALSAKKEALVGGVQNVPVEEVPRNSVEAAVEKPASNSVTGDLTQHEEIQAADEESVPTKHAEIAVGIEDKVESPKDDTVIESSVSEGATSAPISDGASAENDQIQTDAVIGEASPTQTAVNAAAKEISLISPVETVVAKQEETFLDAEGNEHLKEITKSNDQIEPPKDLGPTDEHTTIAADTSVEIVKADPTIVTPPVTTIAVAAQEVEEPALSQEEVEAVVSTIPSVAEPAVVAEIKTQAVNLQKLAVEVGGRTSSNESEVQANGTSPDEQLMKPGAAESGVKPFTETKAEVAEAEKLHPTEAPVPVTADLEEISKDDEQPSISTPQVVIDKSSLVEPAEAEKSFEASVQEPSTFLYSTHSQGSPHTRNTELETKDAQEPPVRPWTPSYSVHSQGSPLSAHVSLVQECTSDKEEPFVADENKAVDSEEMKFTDGKAVPLGKQAQNQEILADAFREKEAAPAEVEPPLTTEVETRHRLEATVPATLDSVPTEVSLSEAIATNLEQSSQVHVLQVEDINNSLAEAAKPVTDIEVPRLVLNSGKEEPAFSVAASEQITQGTGVPSYPVVVQGSPAQERPNPFDKDALATTVSGAWKDVELEPPVDEAPTVLTKNDETETSRVVIAKNEVVTKQREETSEDFRVNKSNSVVSTPFIDGDQVEELPVATTTTLESLEDQDNVNQKLTKSSLTPSTTQDEGELNTLSLDQQTNKVQQDMISQDLSTDKKHDENEMMTIDVIKATENVNPVGEVFPVTEQPVAEGSNESKPSVLRLTTSNMNTAADDSSVTPDAVSPAADRSRLESTGSSRFFPGGWFSPSKTVDESRPFFEVVQGEFTAQKVAAERDPSIDEGPSVTEQSATTQGETRQRPQPKEQKSRWCVIM